MGGEQGVVAKLKQRLQSQPNDAKGWYYLGRIYFSQNNFSAAASAFNRANQLQPDDESLLVQLAESSYLSHDTKLQQEAKTELQKALKLNPQDPAALNLSALMLYHENKYQAAINIWQNLLAIAPEGSDTANALQAAIAQANTKISPTTKATDTNTPSNSTAMNLPIGITIKPTLLNQIKDGSVLFVYAKAVNGPPMPLAITRLPVSTFPIKVNLSDDMTMAPTLHMHDYSSVIVTARISASGQALPQTGDLIGYSQPLSPQHPPKNIVIVIDKKFTPS